MSSSPRRTRDAWIDAAIAHGAEVGFDRLAVEPLAARIGATKGSFYWHFADRAALLDAVTERWEARATQDVIAAVADRDDAEELLLDAVLGDPQHDRIEWRILAAADEARVGASVARVHEARIGFLAELLQRRGMPAAGARARAHVLYAAYLGNLMLLHGAAPLGPVPGLRAELRRMLDAGTRTAGLP